jgi:electron transport complex protein RnfG
MLKSSLSLAIIAGVCASLLALTQSLTDERIEQNTRQRELRLITELTGTTPPTSGTWSGDVWDLGNQTVLARAEVTGYGGPVSLVIASTVVQSERRLTGIRITGHQETPGLADFLGHPERGWLARFSGANRTRIGEIDTVAGATITSRAVRRGVLKALSHTQGPVPLPAGCGP